MGNNCCCLKQENSPKNSQQNKQIQGIEFNILEIQIIVKVGDITKETADAIVSGTDNYVRNRSNSFLKQSFIDSLNKAVTKKRGYPAAAAQEPLFNGQVIITGPANFTNVKNVIHIAVPMWRGGQQQEVESLKKGFIGVLDESSKNNISSIIFTDIAASLFGFPKQITAKILMQAILEYAQRNQQNSKVKTIKFIHKECETVLIFQEHLMKEVGLEFEKI